jgi:hypothetical protein
VHVTLAALLLEDELAAGDVTAIMPGTLWAKARTARTAAACDSPAIA